MKREERTPEGEDTRMLGALLRIPYQTLTVRIQQGLVAAGYPEFHASHLAILQHIKPEGSWMSELAEATQMTKQATNYLIEYLEDHHFVVRTTDPRDGRARLVKLTPQGREVDRTAREIIRQTQLLWSAQLGPERMEILHQTLQDLVALIEQAH